jgi:hypothetical protein
VQQQVVLAGDGVGAQDLGHGGELTGKAWIVGIGVLCERDEDERFDAQAELLVVHHSADALDDAGGAQTLHAP